MSRTFLPIFFDAREFLLLLSGEEVKELLLALLDFCEHGIETSFPDRTLQLAYCHLRNSALSSMRKYEAICQRNRENGAKGGRPKTQQNPVGMDAVETSQERTRTKQEGKTEENRKKSRSPPGAATYDLALFEEFTFLNEV